MRVNPEYVSFPPCCSPERETAADADVRYCDPEHCPLGQTSSEGVSGLRSHRTREGSPPGPTQLQRRPGRALCFMARLGDRCCFCASSPSHQIVFIPVVTFSFSFFFFLSLSSETIPR